MDLVEPSNFIKISTDDKTVRLIDFKPPCDQRRCVIALEQL
jgi:hypothetical protein